MEVIKKKIKLATKLEKIEDEYNIIPDTSKVYNFKIHLTSTPLDLGFFDTLDDPLATGVTGSTVNTEERVVTGNSTSRLYELEKYTINPNISVKYRTSTTPDTDGLNVSLTNTGTSYVYYLGGITYTDDVVNGTTTFSYTTTGSTSPAFVNLPIIKDDRKQNIIDKPIIDNNVFIIRQEQSVFENTYRLRNIDNLTELEYYAGGGYFNIVNNT